MQVGPAPVPARALVPAATPLPAPRHPPPQRRRRRPLGFWSALMILLPAAFTMQTGRDHWEVLLRARAIENLCWVVGVGQWGEAPPNHLCFGRSMVVDPWGLVTAQAPDGVTNVTADIELQSVKDVRTRFPALDHVRDDIFTY